MRQLVSLLIAVLTVAAFTSGADAQAGPRGFRGGFARGPFFHGPRYWRQGFYRQPPFGYPPPPIPPPRMAGSRMGGPGLTGPPQPPWRDQQEMARQGVRVGHLAPLDRVILAIGRQTPGRQLDTGIEYRGDRPVYRVRWITDRGRRVDYVVDAASGAILGQR